jgi:DNA-binding response OmpR family regulator
MRPRVTLAQIVIVIVDDDDDIRFTLSEFLLRKGATVFSCSDAGEALEAVRAHRPNLVLSDISLPKRDGFQLLQDIRRLDPEHGGEVPVVAMTALDGILENGWRIRAGFQGRLGKPFGPDELLATVYSTLDDGSSSEPDEPDGSGRMV